MMSLNCVLFTMFGLTLITALVYYSLNINLIDFDSIYTFKKILTEQSNNQTIVFIPAVVLPGRLNVSCRRQYYCNTTKCSPVIITVANANYRNLFNSSLNIQYWGDSVQNQFLCDLNQWYLEETLESTEQKEKRFNVSFSFLQIGCPWRCIPRMHMLKQYAIKADVVVYNLGSHYELPLTTDGRFNSTEMFPKNLKQHALALALTVQHGGLVIVRSPSATHFPSRKGLYDPKKLNMYANQKCTPLQSLSVPDVILKQDRQLRIMAKSINATYLDIYNLSKNGTKNAHQQHRGNLALDCRHFCQNCGMLRAWNTLVADLILRQKEK
eukprot:UN00965